MDTNLLSLEDEQKITNLASEILRQGRNKLIVHLRFLDLALGQFSNSTFTNFEIPSYTTNGKNFVFNPIHVINRYRENNKGVSRDFLHLILHCIYRHMFVSSYYEPKYWNLACDMAIENAINELNEDFLSDPKQVEQQRQINKLKDKVRHLTAECFYEYFKNANLPDDKIEELSNLFYSDAHDGWYRLQNDEEGNQTDDKKHQDKDDKQNKDQNGDDQSEDNNEDKDDKSNDQDKNQDEDQDKDEKEGDGDGQGQDQEEQDSQSDDQDGNGNGDGEDEEEDSGNNSSSSSSSSSSSNQNSSSDTKNNMSMNEIKELMDHWQEISEKVQVDLETFNKDKGDNAGSMVQNLKEVNREKYDYTSFLKKFATMGEMMKINDDEFDYVYYTYGLSVYKNMPLIEPLEYKDIKRIKDFVIAIDTSGSVQGQLVQTFLQKTFNILKSTESFFSKINLHIIQCDAQIHEDKKITNQSEFDEYIKNMELKGFGGTDFRPVFEYVNELVEQKEFTNLKGLIYFTDGCGTYPLVKPEYQTAFVFIDDNDFNNYNVPSWAVKLVLEKKDI